MLGDHNYPITIVEVHSFMNEIDHLLSLDEQLDLKSYLALHPEGGDLIPGFSGVRCLLWPLNEEDPKIRVAYYFRDLNMPVYLLAVYRDGEQIDVGTEAREKVAELVEELLTTHSNTWGLVAVNNEGA
ncbi:hypothetical protein [Dongia mobilis]|uniref:hypothetical protein n=1 Tax=Dongia sp. TaxID=1977262 RepID=UPI0026EC2E70